MLKYISTRLLLLVLVLVGVLVITFFVTRLVPGSPVSLMLGARPTAAEVAAKTVELGLDRPVYEQFFRYASSIATGDLGTSFHTKRPVTTDILERSSATFELVTISLVVALLIGAPLGVFSAVKQNTPSDYAARFVATIGMAMPLFLSGMLLQIIFYGDLSVLPLHGRLSQEFISSGSVHRYTGLLLFDTLLSGNLSAFADAARHLMLPVATLVIASLGVMMRVTRNTVIEVLSQDHILASRALGIGNQLLYWRYTFKATLVPLLTVVGLTYGYLLGGAVVVEFIFDWPGLGGYAIDAIAVNDYPAVMGVTFVLAAANLIVNLIVDLLYFALDPRTRLT
ncbi:ABC transporter permease subunit [Sinorhizobium medicae]|uniref:ABC transporter permease n=1 Tax=Sinorhizobium medicae TaxID=110321 RepID=UPI001294DC89|nr:ABC transporter permease [Sinorhizobium medicae]MQW02010.1 ABC transporter permease subunit [Sinorhizobium medicae]